MSEFEDNLDFRLQAVEDNMADLPSRIEALETINRRLVDYLANIEARLRWLENAALRAELEMPDDRP